MESSNQQTNERLNKMNEEKLSICNKMIDICQQMDSSGINQGTAGNLSIRYNEGFLITPTSLPYNEMKPDDIVGSATKSIQIEIDNLLSHMGLHNLV